MWFTLAVGAAALWGVSYALSEWIFERISVPTYLTIEFFLATIVFAAVSIFNNHWKEDLSALSQPKLLLALGFCIATLIAAELCINFSISEKNATLASLIELSYPVFVVIASYAIFRTTHLNLATFIGGFLVLCGVATIYAFAH